MCAHMLVYMIAHRGRMNTIKECILKVDFGRKIPFLTGESNPNPHQHCTWLFGLAFYQLSYPIPVDDSEHLVVISQVLGENEGYVVKICDENEAYMFLYFHFFLHCT